VQWALHDVVQGSGIDRLVPGTGVGGHVGSLA
jgi:hypothetical protein